MNFFFCIVLVSEYDSSSFLHIINDSTQEGIQQACWFFLGISPFGPSVLKFYACNSFLIRWEMSIKWFIIFFRWYQTNVCIYFSHYLYSWSPSSSSLLSKPPAYVCRVPSCGFAYVNSWTGLRMCIGYTHITQYFATNFRCFLLTWSFFSWYFSVRNIKK